MAFMTLRNPESVARPWDRRNARRLWQRTPRVLAKDTDGFSEVANSHWRRCDRILAAMPGSAPLPPEPPDRDIGQDSVGLASGIRLRGSLELDGRYRFTGRWGKGSGLIVVAGSSVSVRLHFAALTCCAMMRMPFSSHADEWLDRGRISYFVVRCSIAASE
jgi:hypothetical protein